MFGAHSKFVQALVGSCGAVLAFATSALCLAQGATPTQTTLSITPKFVQQGTSVTLTAVVTSGGEQVHPGIVVSAMQWHRAVKTQPFSERCH